ncbi:hypothetical protein ACFL59_09820 [Planctomycetota bacterium]
MGALSCWWCLKCPCCLPRSDTLPHRSHGDLELVADVGQLTDQEKHMLEVPQ